MGEVFLAQDTRLGRKVAIKLLATQLTNDRDRLRRFETKARAASGLNHPNIVTIYDIGSDEAGCYIVMELIEGETLRALTGDPMAFERLVPIGRQVAEALAVAHEAGIVHRDIKPENVMVREDGYVKVLDFGLVRLLPGAAALPEDETEMWLTPAARDTDTARRRTDAGMLLGTVAYMSPEQTRGRPVDSATDVFSLGIMLFELATGRHPFRAESNIGTLNAIRSEPPVAPSRLNSQLPLAFEGLILRMLEKDPRLRPSAKDVSAELRELGRIHALPARPVPAPAVKRHTVGREAERARLRAAYAKAASGAACLVMRGRCSEQLAGTEAYLPILEALDSLLQVRDENVLQMMKTLAPTWYAAVTPPATDDSSAQRVLADAKLASQERMKREMASLLTHLSGTQPLVLVLDDLHWADLASVDLLAYLAAHFDQMHVLIVAAFRPSELLMAEHPLIKITLDLQSCGECEEVALGFLGTDEIGRYLALEFPEHRFPDNLPGLIHAKTEGSPLFMADLVRYLRDRGVIAEQDGHWQLVRPIPDLDRELPASVRSMIQRKIDQLDEADRPLLVAASVQGHEFDTAVVARSLNLDAAEVEDRLEHVQRVHALVQLVGEHEFPDATLTVRYRFVHALYQNALYALLNPTRRAAASGAVAEALIEFHPNQTEGLASTLALLFEIARDFERASDFFLLAAQNAARLYANQEAVELWGRVIANGERVRPPDEGRLLAAYEGRALVWNLLTQYDKAIADFEVMRRLAKSSGNRQKEGDSLCHLSYAYYLKFSEEQTPLVVKYAQEAQHLAQQIGDQRILARSLSILALADQGAWKLEAAERKFRESLEIARREGYNESLPPTLMLLTAQAYWLGEFLRALQLGREGVSVSRDVHDGLHELWCLAFLSLIHWSCGRYAQTLGMMPELMTMAKDRENRFFSGRFMNHLGWFHSEFGDFSRALEYDRESVEHGREHGVFNVEISALINLGLDHSALGQHERALSYLLPTLDRVQREGIGSHRWLWTERLLVGLAEVHYATGMYDEALRYVEDSLKKAPRKKYEAKARALRGKIAMKMGDTDTAGAEFRTAFTLADELRSPSILYPIAYELGHWCETTGKVREARGLYEKAKVTIERMADSVGDEGLRTAFLRSPRVREISER